MTRSVTKGIVRVTVLDSDLQTVRSSKYPAALTATLGTGDGVIVVAMRMRSTARVRIYARDADTGSILWRRSATRAFDPSEITLIGNRAWVASHRMGDGAVRLESHSLRTG